ncbi:MAG: S8 family peptidase [bacterium]|nr:S8 family peptidase [bacterium]
MKGLILTLLLSCSVFCINAQTIDTNFVDGKIYVRTVQGASLDLSNYDSSNLVLNGILASYAVTDIAMPFPGVNNELDRTFEFTFNQWSQVDALINELELLADVEYAEKKVLHKTTMIPNDVHPSQWALTKIQAFDAWDITTGDAQIKIAIVDNAVSNVHEDLQSAIWVNQGEVPNNGLDDDLNGFTDDYQGWDAADGDGNPNPPTSAGSSSPFTHGTHCAGIASASTNNGTGVAAIGFNTLIIPVKCSPDGSSSEGAALTNAYDGVYYAMQVDADIISMSFGSEFPSLTGESIISAASQMGITLVAAAGNSATDAPHYPAAYQNVISVGATNQSDMITWFSNYGSSIDVMAPGLDIYSTLSGAGDEYGSKSGTSMACPMVAGLAGLVLSQDPSRTPAEVEMLLEAGCDPIDLLNPGYEGMLGAGRINALKTLDQSASLSENNTNLTVYPNPAEEFVLLDASLGLQKAEWISVSGTISNVGQLYESSGEIRIATPKSPGVYLLKMYIQNDVVHRKIVVR